MSKESFDQEKELDELEKELHNKISKLEQAPLRHGFTEELRNSLQLAIHNKEKEGASGIKWKKRGFFLQFNRLLGTRNVKLAAGFLLFVLLCGGFFWGWSGLNSSVKPALAGEIEIKALQEDKLGVAAESAFLLTSQNPLAQKTVQKHLKVQPAFEYALDKRAGGREYKIIPKKKLATNTVYKLTFDPGGKERESFSWAFQTKGQFKIMRTLPADRTTHVPVNTGIEIAFSHENFQLKKAGKYFTISPQVEGRFEKHKKTLVFIPQQLKAETLYTVTVKKGFPMTDSTEVLGEDYSFSFETAPDGINEEKFSFHMDNSLTEFSTAEAPAFAVYSYSDSKEKTSNVAVSVYRYAEHKSFIKALQKQEKVPSWASFAWKSQQEDFRKLTKVGAFKTDLLSLDNYSHYVTFPEKLPVGYYAAEIQIGEAKRQVWFQVTDLTVYEAQSAAKSLFWVNDLQTKKPVDGAELLLENLQLSFKGNAQGVIFVEQKLSIPSGSYALIKKDNREIVVPLFSTEETNFTNEGIDTRDYWKYLYIDRELFKPGDTVNFWGVLDPRKGAVPINEVEIELNGTGWGYYTRNENAPLLSKKVKIDSKIFTGEIQLPTLTPGYYYLKVKKGETILLSRGISVELYQKPAYKISVEPEKRAVFAGEQVNFLAQTAFFEGTPVPKTDLHYSVWDKEGTVVTDAQGRAIIPYAAGTDNSFSTYRSIYLGVNATLPEAGEISASSKVWVFQSKVNLEGNVTREGKSFILNTQLSQINLDRVNAGEYPEKENFVTGPVAGSLIKGSIYQDVWKKVENGNYYNFITKRVEKRYYYDHSTKNISDFEMVTDQAGKATFRGTLDTEGSYYLVLTVQDADGRISQRRVYISDTNYAYYNDDYYKYYHLQLEKREQGFVPGEKVSLTFMENTKELPSKKQGFLILQGQKEIESFAVLNQAKYEFTFQKEDLPNVHVGGVYFDGTSYQEASLELVRFDKEQKALKISIVTDKQEYKPKEKVKLQVQVTDGQNNPVQAKVNLNLVDEALYQLRDQQVDFLSELYNDFIPLFLRTRVSHYHPNLGGGAECGGEGDSERKDFFDTVLFTTVETNSRGEAVTEFTLPDNLTSWRVTYHGVTQDLQAGSGTSQILVRLPFFVEMVGKEVYLAGDVPVIVLRAYGSEVSANASVAYRMELSGPDGKKVTQKGQGIVGEGLDWQLPVLQEGKYTLVVEGKSGKYSDKLRKEFTVVNSFLERTSTTYQLLQENLKLQGSTREPTLVVFSDEEKSQYLRGLYQLAWQFGGRLEQKLAAQEARRLLEQYFTKQTFFYSENEESLQAYQQADGGISILPYAESEPILTALVASVGSSDFDRRTMAGYFYQQLETGKEKGEDVTLALWGLGALGEPVLLEINSYLAQKDLAPAEKVHLALAALDIGNGAYARKVYGELLDQYGEELGNSMRIKIGRDQDEIITATTQMALLSAKLGTAEKNKLYQYILENPGEELLNNLEQVQILKYNLRYMDSEPVSFTYELDGKKVKKTLKGRETFTLHVLPEDLSKIKFTAIKGKVGVMTAYSQTYQAEQIPDRNDLEVKRTYRLMGNTTNILQRGDLVEVELEYQIKNLAPRGNYELVDVLPAGLSYVQRPYQRTNYLSSNWSYPSEVKGQKITFNVSKVGKGDGVHRVVYYARVVSPGEFIAQGTLLSHVKYNDLCILGKEDRIVIK